MKRPISRIAAVVCLVMWAGTFSFGCTPQSRPLAQSAAKLTALRIRWSGARESDTRVFDNPGAVGVFAGMLAKAKPAPIPGGCTTTYKARFKVGEKWVGADTDLVTENVMPQGFPSYLKWGDTWYELPREFFAAVEAPALFPVKDWHIDADDQEYLKRFGYTPFYLMNARTVMVPKELVQRSGDSAKPLYWAMVKELCVDSGLDLGPLLGKSVEVRIYKTVQALPEAIVEQRQAHGRALVIRFDGRPVGAWLDGGGMNPTEACSMKGRSLSQVTGQTLSQWAATLIDPTDPSEQGLATVTPEELFARYFAAISRKDWPAAYACLAPGAIMSSIRTEPEGFYDGGFIEDLGGGWGNYRSITLLKVEPNAFYQATEAEGLTCFDVTVDAAMIEQVGGGDGIDTMHGDVTRLANGWRIWGLGHGK